MFGRKDKEPPRFVLKESCTVGACSLSVIRDTVTGVNYLATAGTDFTFSSITPLLDENGNVVIDKNMPET